MKKKISILSTKKLKKEIIDQAVIDGFNVIEHDFININFLKEDWSHLHEVLVFTSANAVLAFEKNNSGERVYKAWCLQGETFDTLSKLSNVSIAGTAENALALAKRISEDKSVPELSFICSRQRRNELPDYLRAHDVRVDELVAYETTSNARAINEAYDAVLFFSPSAVQSFFELNSLAVDARVFCIGNTTAGAFANASGSEQAAIIPSATTQGAMMQTVKKYYEYSNATEPNKFGGFEK